MEQNFNENPHPCVGVMYPAFLDDTPAEWRDLPPDGLTLEEDAFGVIYPAVLDELDPLDDGEVETVNEAFRPKCVITPDDYPLPKEGTVGYVKLESKHYEGPELKPRLFDVDEYRFEVVG